MRKVKLLMVPLAILTLAGAMNTSVGTVLAQADADYSTGTVITHTVRPGEYLNKIANNYGVTANELRLWNHLTTDLLQIGQQLKIVTDAETPPPTGSVYTVRAGDTLWRIANTYGVTVNQIKSWNNLSSDFLYIGMRLVVADQGTTPPPSEGLTYTVRSGDTLWSIANRYGVTVNQLKSWNNLSSDFLAIGMRLNIRGGDNQPPSQGTVHRVQPGDTLFNLAYRYGTSVNQLKAWNNLTSDLIYIGTYLRVSQP